MYGYDTLSANAEDTIEHLNHEIDNYQPSKWKIFIMDRSIQDILSFSK